VEYWAIGPYFAHVKERYKGKCNLWCKSHILQGKLLNKRKEVKWTKFTN
jgi:hypothetical protein